jgi:hypothetical protein
MLSPWDTVRFMQDQPGVLVITTKGGTTMH